MSEFNIENEMMEQNNRETSEMNNETAKGENKESLGESFAERALAYDLDRDIEFARKKNPNYTGTVPHRNRGELSRLANEMAEEKVNENSSDKQGEGKESLGYSSDHYKWEMGQALKSGNQIWYENAKRHYGEAKAREMLGEGEAAETGEEAKDSKASKEGEEALGYSSEYYKNEYASAISSGNKIAADNALKHFKEAKARENSKK